MGLGAFGDTFAACQERFGEFLGIAGAVACQPADGTNFPDYMMSSGTLVPSLSLLYGLCCEGGFSRLMRFESASGSDPLPRAGRNVLNKDIPLVAELARLYDLDVPITQQLAAAANRVVEANEKRNKKS